MNRFYLTSTTVSEPPIAVDIDKGFLISAGEGLGRWMYHTREAQEHGQERRIITAENLLDFPFTSPTSLRARGLPDKGVHYFCCNLTCRAWHTLTSGYYECFKRELIDPYYNDMPSPSRILETLMSETQFVNVQGQKIPAELLEAMRYLRPQKVFDQATVTKVLAKGGL